MNRSMRCPAEVPGRGAHVVFEHEREYGSQWATFCSIAVTPEVAL